jgi:hypothetical protein
MMRTRTSESTCVRFFCAGVLASMAFFNLGLAHAAGSGLYFIADAPIAKFSDQDRELFYAQALAALNDAADGEDVAWSNPASFARGVVTPVRTVTDPVYGLCRQVRVSNEVGTVRRSGLYRACRASNGTWRLLSAGADATSESSK